MRHAAATQTFGRQRISNNSTEFRGKIKILPEMTVFTLYAPYVAIPHIRIISREIAEAMHMSVTAKKRTSYNP